MTIDPWKRKGNEQHRRNRRGMEDQIANSLASGRKETVRVGSGTGTDRGWRSRDRGGAGEEQREVEVVDQDITRNPTIRCNEDMTNEEFEDHVEDEGLDGDRHRDR